jgi:short chain dehydrogenase
VAPARGAKVVLAARNGEALDHGVREVEESGSQALAVPTDVADLEQVQRLVARAVAHFGRIDTFVANAMVTVYAEVDRLEPDELRRAMDAYQPQPVPPTYQPEPLTEAVPGDPGARGRFSDRSRKGTAWTSIRLLRWLG